MDPTVIAHFTERIQRERPTLIEHERGYKLEGAADARRNVAEALSGDRPWQQVFVGSARKILLNLLASNQWSARAAATLVEFDAAVLNSMVEHLWQRDDLEAAATDLVVIVDDERIRDTIKSFRSIGGRAAVLSFFRFLNNPSDHPMFRPGHVTRALEALGLPSLPTEHPAALLRAYDAVLDRVLEAFRGAGLELADRLDAQAVLWAVRNFAEEDRATPSDGSRTSAPPPTSNPATTASKRNGGATAAQVAEQLPALQSWLRASGLHYPDALVATHLAALLTKPFVVLSGLSGTGKTRLAISVGERLGPVHVVPVKPDWTDTRAVLGYLNPLTQRYETTAALDALLEARAGDGVVTLVLDEMNLAHVEHYFADILSAMESGHPIPLHASEEVEREQCIPRSLYWPDNLLVVGTVNADETTYPFSPKVLDRAFVIDVNHMDLPRYLADAVPTALGEPPTLPTFAPSRAWRTLGTSNDDLSFIRELHALMRDAERPFGYRSVDESLAFLTHARAFEASGLQPTDALIATKILPRLHGRRHELEPALHALAKHIGIDLDVDDDEISAPTHPLTAAVLRTMSRQLDAEGYVASMVG